MDLEVINLPFFVPITNYFLNQVETEEVSVAMMIVLHATMTTAVAHAALEDQIEDPTEAVQEVVGSRAKAIGSAQVVKTRTLHGETNAIVAKSQKQMMETLGAQEVADHPKEGDSKAVTTTVQGEETEVLDEVAGVLTVVAQCVVKAETIVLLQEATVSDPIKIFCSNIHVTLKYFLFVSASEVSPFLQYLKTL